MTIVVTKLSHYWHKSVMGEAHTRRNFGLF